MDPGFVPLTTDRLTLRPWRAEDVAELHRLMNDWQVCSTLAAVPFPYSRNLADEWIVSATTQLADGSAINLAITGTEDGAEMLVGGLGLRLVGDAGRLGYWVGRRFWGHGVATEAAGKLARWAKFVRAQETEHSCDLGVETVAPGLKVREPFGERCFSH